MLFPMVREDMVTLPVGRLVGQEEPDYLHQNEARRGIRSTQILQSSARSLQFPLLALANDLSQRDHNSAHGLSQTSTGAGAAR